MEIAFIMQFLIILRLSKEYNKNYRKIIYELCNSSIEDIKELFYSDKDDPDINLKERIEQAKNYIEGIRQEGNWAGDIEINKMAELLDVNIICYTKNDNEFKLQAVYFGSKEKLNIIPLRFVNNNHFEILYPKNFVMPLKKISFDTKDLKLKKTL